MFPVLRKYHIKSIISEQHICCYGTNLYPLVIEDAIVRPGHLNHELFHFARKAHGRLGDISPLLHLSSRDRKAVDRNNYSDF